MRDKTRMIWGGALILVGILMGGKALGWFDFDIGWKLIFPILIIVFGLMILFGVNGDDKEGELSDKDEISAAFSGQKVKFDSQEITKKSLSAVFGGIEADFRKAKIKNEAHIKADSIFGGIKIMVPSDVDVEVRSTSIFGGVTNKTISGDDEKDKEKKSSSKEKLYIDAVCMFGGVEVI